jgi:hypothetical protein
MRKHAITRQQIRSKDGGKCSTPKQELNYFVCLPYLEEQTTAAPGLTGGVVEISIHTEKSRKIKF